MAKFKKNKKLQGTPVGKAKYNNQKNKVVSKIKKKAIANAGRNNVGDARNVLHAKSRRQMLTGDARDKLAKIAKGTDARQKLEKIRNLKEGKFDVKKTKKGGITIVTTTQGQLQLTTKKNVVQLAAGKNKSGKNGQNNQVNKDKVSKIGKNLTKSVNQAGKISLSTKPKNSTLTASSLNTKNSAIKKRKAAILQEKGRLALKPATAGKLQVRVKQQPMSRAARLDDELINTHVDPVLIRRTVRQSVRERSRSPLAQPAPNYRERLTERPRYRSRSRSPVHSSRDYDRVERPRYHFDDPRREQREEELLRQKIRDEDRRRQLEPPSYHLTSEGMANTTPFAGTKAVVSNLQASVSQEDLSELFGDVGPLRRVKMLGPGSAEIVFLNKEDADRAIEVYHNRQLDGQPMKCQLVTSGPAPKAPAAPRLRLPAQSSASARRGGHDEDRIREPTDMAAVHKALFGDRKKPFHGMSAVPYASSGGGTGSSSAVVTGTGSRSAASQKFTVVMPQNSSNQRRARR